MRNVNSFSMKLYNIIEQQRKIVEKLPSSGGFEEKKREKNVSSGGAL